MIGAGGVYSSLNDMTKYLMFHINEGVVNGERLLREDLMNEYHSIQFARPGQNSGWALGLLKVNDVNEVFQAGGGFGFFGYMAMYPDFKLGVVLLTNSSSVDFSGESFRFIDFKLLEHIGHTRPRLPMEELVPLDPKDPRIRPHIGRYGSGHAPELAYDGDTVICHSSGNTLPVNFYDHNGELTGLVGDDLVVKFMPALGEQPGAAMVYHQNYGNSYNNFYFFNDSPTDEPGPDKLEWDKYVGQYDFVVKGEKLGSVEVTRRNGYLYYGEQKLTEYEEGLFFMYDGWELNFNGPTPRAGHLPIVKVQEGE
jgi:CubicO group peptidase (beta-lactamase class C family)